MNAKGDNNSNKRLTLASCVLNSPERVDLETKLNGNITDYWTLLIKSMTVDYMVK